FVLPVARFPLSHPFDRRIDAPFSRVLSLCFRDPVCVLALVTGRKLFERRGRLFVLFQRFGELQRNDELFLGLGSPRRFYPLLVELRRLFDIARQRFSRREIRELGDVAQRTPRFVSSRSNNQVALPEDQIAVLLERGDSTQ